uniref:Uncharacterized protein n=1 Tax=Rhizophora mucronata TaxID=61149 RepID=A0A2P2PG49_RHIMU
MLEDAGNSFHVICAQS